MNIGLTLFAPVPILIVVSCVAFWVWMLADCATREPDSGNTRLMWVIIIIFTGIIGAGIYYFARRPRRKAEMGR